MEQVHITLSGKGLKDLLPLTIQIAINATIDIDARTAQKKVTRWLVSEVGNMLMGDTPYLVINPHPVWRTPIMLTSSDVGIVGQAGWVDVNANNGELLLHATLRDEILAHVKHLVT